MGWLRRLTLPPWRRAPLRLLHSASLLWAVVVAAIVLGIAGGSRPLFVSSAASAAINSDITHGCAFDVGMRVQRQASTKTPGPPRVVGEPIPPVELAAGTNALNEAVAGLPGLAPVVVTLFGGTAQIRGADDAKTSQVQLLSRTGARQHLQVVHEVAAPGIWLPDSTARAIGVAAGEHITLEVNLVPTPLTVHAVFRDLTEVRRDRSWCSLEQTLDGFGISNPPPTGFLDQRTLLRLLSHSHLANVEAWWEYAPGPHGWTIEKAKKTLPALTLIARSTGDLSSPQGSLLGFGTTSVDGQSTIAHSEDAARTASASVGPVALGGAGVALLVLLIAARAWLERRRKEVTVLALRGAGPGLLAIKGVLEMGPPMVIGGALGIVIGDLLVKTVGPSSAVDSHALGSAARLVGLAVAIALGAVAIVAWLGGRRMTVDAASDPRRSRLLLWEPAVLALAGAAYYELSTRPTPTTAAAPGGHIDSLVLLFPVLLLAGCAGLIARALFRGNALRRSTGRLSTWAWLGARRVSAGRRRAVPLVTCAAVSIGIVVFSGTLAASLRATIGAKSTLGVGAAQTFTIAAPQPLPAAAPVARIATEVTRVSENANGDTSHAPADILGVEPATFARGAYWDSSFASRSLSSLLRALSPPADGSALPVVAVGDGLPDRFVLSLDSQRAGERTTSINIEVQVVGRARAFPGYGFESSRPLVVVDRDALAKAGIVDSPQVWVNRTDPLVRSRLLAAGMNVTSVARASDLTPADLTPQLWALDYIQLIGLVAGVVTMCGVGLYFASIASRRRLGTALARRMGMSRRVAIASTGCELGIMLGAGLAIGSGLSALAVRLVFDHIDSAPEIPPSPLFRFDGGSVIVCAVGALVATVLVTAVVEWRAARVPLSELLRHAE